MKFIMHDENHLINQKMIELTSISANHLSFSPLKSMDILKASNPKFRSKGGYCPRLTSASSDVSNEEHEEHANEDCEDEFDGFHISGSTYGGTGDFVKANMKINNGNYLPSPPNSSRSSFDNDGMTRDSFTSLGGNFDVSDNCLYESYAHDNETPSDTFEDDIKLVAENLIKMVVDEYERQNDEPKADAVLWDNLKIDENGETVLPNGLRLIDGVVEMSFYREHPENEPPRFTNQLNFLKTILTKYICRYKSAMPFLAPVNCLRLKIPHYYRVIRQPMDLNTVKNRINFLWYQTGAECISDLRLIFSNCYQFNSPSDYVYKAGQKLEEYLNEKLKDMPSTEMEILCPPMPNIDEYQKQSYKKIFKPRTDSISSENGDTSVNIFGPIKMTTRSERGVMVRKPSKDLPTPISTPQPRPPSTRKVPLNVSMKYCHDFVKELFNKKHAEYAWPFWEPVKVHEYPDYAQKIKRPIDLSTIRTNIETGRYSTVSDFANDVRLMISNCYRYNKPESPIIEQARKLREVFEYKYARIPEDWLHEKLVVQHHSSNGRNTSPSVRQNSASKQVETLKIKKPKALGDNRKSVKNSGQINNFLGANIPSTSTMGESRMQLLERQVATLTSALQVCLGANYATGPSVDPSMMARMGGMAMPQNISPNGKPGRGRPRKNGIEPKGPYTKKTAKKQAPSRKRKHHLSSDEESDSEDDLPSVVNAPEPINFDPEDLDDLKKLKSDLENLRAKDLQNVLKILQETEPSLRCDDESNVEIDFEALKPKTLIALRKYVTSCMLNATSSAKSNPTSTSNPSSSKRLCQQPTNLLRSNLDTDCDTPNINNWSRAGSRASDLQLSEESSSDSEED